MTTTFKPSRIIVNGMLLLLLLLNTLFLSAQKSPLSVSLTGGVSFPVGAFAGKSVHPTSSSTTREGAVYPGLNSNLQINVRITPKLWVNVIGGISKYNRDLDILYREAQTGYKQKAKGERWEVYKLLAGPSLRLPLGNKFSVRSGVAAGIANTSIPTYKTTYYDPAGNPLATYPSSPEYDLPTAFAYQVNAGVAYKIGQQLSLLFDANYFGARTSGVYEWYPITIGPGPAPDPGQASGPFYTRYKHPLNSISAVVGLEWNF